MKVYWKEKWMSIPYQGSPTVLQGLGTLLPEGIVLEVCAVLISDSQIQELPLPPELSLLLDEFAAVFASPSGLPPARDCDHAIPLIEGATPVSV
jgi:hypothetical protein